MALDLAWSVGYSDPSGYPPWQLDHWLAVWLPFGVLVLLLVILFLRGWWTIRQAREAAAELHDFGEALQATEDAIEQSTAEPEDQA